VSIASFILHGSRAVGRARRHRTLAAAKAIPSDMRIRMIITSSRPRQSIVCIGQRGGRIVGKGRPRGWLNIFNSGGGAIGTGVYPWLENGKPGPDGSTDRGWSEFDTLKGWSRLRGQSHGASSLRLFHNCRGGRASSESRSAEKRHIAQPPLIPRCNSSGRSGVTGCSIVVDRFTLTDEPGRYLF